MNGLIAFKSGRHRTAVVSEHGQVERAVTNGFPDKPPRAAVPHPDLVGRVPRVDSGYGDRPGTAAQIVEPCGRPKLHVRDDAIREPPLANSGLCSVLLHLRTLVPAHHQTVCNFCFISKQRLTPASLLCLEHELLCQDFHPLQKLEP